MMAVGGAVTAFTLAGAGSTSAAASALPVPPAKPGSVVAGRPSSTAAKPATTAPGNVHPMASPCWYNGGRWWCNNVVGAAVYRYPDYTHGVVGHMYSNPSWFNCRREDSWVGGPHPYRWEYTESDDGGWGFMPDTSIYSETDPLPYNPACGLP